VLWVYKVGTQGSHFCIFTAVVVVVIAVVNNKHSDFKTIERNLATVEDVTPWYREVTGEGHITEAQGKRTISARPQSIDMIAVSQARSVTGKYIRAEKVPTN